MTIATTESRVDYAGNGSTTAFAIPYPFFGPAELTVILRTNATGVETTWALGVQYTVTGGDGATGTLTATTAPAIGTTLTILRATARLQPIDYVENDPFPAQSHERGLDRLTAIVQEIERDQIRALRVAATDATPTALPTAGERAGKVLAFDTNGNPIALTVSGGAIVGPAGPAGEGAPIGGVVPFAGTVLPAGYLWCNGAVVSRTTFAALFAVIGTTYNTGGEASDTFRLPNLMGRVAIGREGMGGAGAPGLITSAGSGINGTVLGATGGSQALASHTHTVSDPGHAHAAATLSNGIHTHGKNGDFIVAGSSFGLGGGGVYGLGGAIASDGGHSHEVTVAGNTTGITVGTTGAGSSGNVQPSLVCNYIIRFAATEASEGGGGGRLVIGATRVTDFTLALGDIQNLIPAGAAGNVTVTVPTNAAVPWPIGESVTLTRIGSGAVSVAAAGGVTVNTPTGANPRARDQWSSITLVKTATDTWTLAGDLEPAAAVGLVVTKCHRSANLSVSNATWTVVPWDVEAFDDAAAHSTSSNTSRIVVPSGYTRARFTAYANWASNNTGARRISIERNAGGVQGAGSGDAASGLQAAQNESGRNADTGVLTVTAGDYYEMFVQQESGGALNLIGPLGSFGGRSYFQAEFWP